MNKQNQTRVVLAVVGVLVVGGLWISLGHKHSRGGVKTIPCKITAVDAKARTASVQFDHPKTGDRVTISNNVPDDCEIQIDGKPAALGDIRVGDRADLGAKIESSRDITLKWVHVQRTSLGSPARTATQSSPAGGS